MTSQEKPAVQQPVRTVGVANDIRRLKADGSASVAELNEFVGQLRGRTPQEMLGIVAQSNLGRSIATATVWCAVLLVVLTVGPYGWKTFVAPEKEQAANGSSAAAASATSQAPSTVPSDSPETPAAPTGVDLQRAGELMGVDQTKNAAPNENPLENKLDKLLEGIDE